MSNLPAAARYRSGLIVLHWLMLILLACSYASMEFRGLFPRGAERDAIKALHYSLGFLVFILVAARIALRVTGDVRPVTPPLPAWQKLGATALHVALYVFMVVMPILGWAILSAKGQPASFFGIVLPPIVSPDRELGYWFVDFHEWIGKAGYALIGLHAAAGLVHHLVRRDDALTGILP
jgi:cytochrome b561